MVTRTQGRVFPQNTLNSEQLGDLQTKLEQSAQCGFELGNISLISPSIPKPNQPIAQANQIKKTCSAGILPAINPLSQDGKILEIERGSQNLEENLLSPSFLPTFSPQLSNFLLIPSFQENTSGLISQAGKSPLQIQRGVGGWLKSKVKGAFDWVKEKIVKPIEAAAKRLLDSLKSQAKNLINNIKSGAKNLVGKAKQQVKQLINKIKAQVKKLIQRAKLAVQKLINKAKQKALKLVNQAKKAANKILNLGRSQVQKYTQRMLKLVQYFMKIGNPKKAQDLIEKIRQFATNILNKCKAKITNISNKITQKIGDLIGKTVGLVNQKLQKAITGVQNLTQKVSTGANQLLNKVSQGIQQKIQQVTQAIPQLFQTVKGKLNGILGPARGKANWLIDKLTNLANSILNNTLMPLVTQATSGIGKLLQPILNLGRSLLQQATGWITKGLQSFSQKLNQLTQTFIQRAKKAIEEILQKVAGKIIETMTQVVGVIVDRIVKFIENIILEPLKAFFEFMEVLSQVLGSAAGVIDKILAHPVNFIKSLFAGVGQGLSTFAKNIGTHLEQGLKTYLLGPVAEMGVELPKSFDLKGLFSIVAQLAGISYKNIRQRAVGKLGEDKVTFIEQGAEAAKEGNLEKFAQEQAQGYAQSQLEGLKAKAGPINQIISLFGALRQGAGGIIDYFKQLDIGALAKMVLDGIKDYLIEQVIQKAIIQVTAYLVPGAGWLKGAIDALRVMYALFIKRAQQVKEIVQGFTQSIVDVANKAISQAATRLEGVLGKSIPVLIGVLADYLGISGLPEKIKGFIGKGQTWVDENIMPMIDNIMDGVSSILGQIPDSKNLGKMIPPSVGVGNWQEPLKRQLIPLTAKPFDTLEQAQTVVSGVGQVFKPMGLNSLELERADEQGQSYEVVAAKPLNGEIQPKNKSLPSNFGERRLIHSNITQSTSTETNINRKPKSNKSQKITKISVKKETSTSILKKTQIEKARSYLKKNQHLYTNAVKVKIANKLGISDTSDEGIIQGTAQWQSQSRKTNPKVIVDGIPGEGTLKELFGTDICVSEEDKKEFELLKGKIEEYNVRSYLKHRHNFFGPTEEYLKFASESDQELETHKLTKLIELTGEAQKVYYRWVRKAYHNAGIEDVPALIKKGKSQKLTDALDKVKKEYGKSFKSGGFNPRPKKSASYKYRLGTLSEHALGNAIDIEHSKNPILSKSEWKFIEEIAGKKIDRSHSRWKKEPEKLWQDIKDVNDLFVKNVPNKIKEIVDADQSGKKTVEDAKKELFAKYPKLGAWDQGFFTLEWKLVDQLHKNGFRWGATFDSVDLHHFELY